MPVLFPALGDGGQRDDVVGEFRSGPGSRQIDPGQAAVVVVGRQNDEIRAGLTPAVGLSLMAHDEGVHVQLRRQGV